MQKKHNFKIYVFKENKFVKENTCIFWNIQEYTFFTQKIQNSLIILQTCVEFALILSAQKYLNNCKNMCFLQLYVVIIFFLCLLLIEFNEDEWFDGNGHTSFTRRIKNKEIDERKKMI